MDDPIKQAFEYGIIGVVLVGVFILLKMFISRAIIPFFDRVSESQSAFLSKASESIGTMSIVLVELKEATVKSSEATKEMADLLTAHSQDSSSFIGKFNGPAEHYQTVKTNEAIHHLARAGRAHLDGHDEETRRELDAAEEAVNQREGN